LYSVEVSFGYGVRPYLCFGWRCSVKHCIATKGRKWLVHEVVLFYLHRKKLNTGPK